MLKKVNWAVCAAAILLAALELISLAVGGAGLILAASVLPQVIIAGVCISAVLIAAWWRRDDAAARPAMLAVACFAVSAVIWLVQVFWMAGMLL